MPEKKEEEVKNVNIFIAQDAMNPDDKVLEGYVNGRFFRVKRGEVVSVPKDIADILTFKRIAHIIAQ